MNLNKRFSWNGLRRSICSGAMAVSLLTLIVWHLDAVAQQSESEIMSSEALTDALKPEPFKPEPLKQRKTRGLKIVSPANDSGAINAPDNHLGSTEVSAQKENTLKPKKAILSIEFEFNSDQLTARSKSQLDALGEALLGPELRAYRFEIAGHTDAMGDEHYNLALSTRRSESVRAYLVEHRGVTGERLQSRGYGESMLLNAAEPDSPQNRRVEIVNLFTIQSN